MASCVIGCTNGGAESLGTPRSLSHLENPVLLRELFAVLADVRGRTATLLAYLAEVDERQLYLPAAHSSMHSYCVHELHMSEGSAYKRITAARVARRFPAILPAVAEGRLHLSAVALLAPRLTAENVDELLAAATHRTKTEIELLLAERFPRPDVATRVRAIAPALAMDELSPGTVDPSIDLNLSEAMEPLSPGTVVEPVISSAAPTAAPHARLSPLSPDRYELRVTVSRDAHDQMRYAQALLGHALPSGDLAKVLERALDALVERLEKQKFAKGARSRAQRGHAKDRHIPAAIRCKVWQRDGGQCTFVSEQGKRCEAKKRLEFDHLEEVARGGETTAENLRLLCRAHNQHAAECTFGAGFMREKREAARAKATERAQEKAIAEARTREKAEARARERAAVQEAKTREKAAAKEASAREKIAEQDAKAQAKAAVAEASEAARERDITPWLRSLGFTAGEARRGVELCAHMPDAPMEDRLKAALRGLAPPSRPVPAW